MNRVLTAGLFSAALLDSAHGQGKTPAKCEAPSPSVTSSVTEYVFEKNHVSTASQLILVSNGQANDDCYWQYKYQIAPAQSQIVLYLAPDHRYLAPTLFDRTADPLAEEKSQRETIVRSLTSSIAASRGRKDATVTLVEFSDFECPYCQRLTAMLEKEIIPNDPDLKVVFRNFPLPMHPWAEQAAEIATCAEMQSDTVFWKLHDYLFSNQRDITPTNVSEKLFAVADAEPGIKHDVFHACVDEALTMGPVSKDVEIGKRFGVRATPTIFLNGSKVEGVRDAAQLKELIESARAGKLPATMPEVPQSGSRTAAANRPAPANSDACVSVR